jgi:hypothetical protein
VRYPTDSDSESTKFAGVRPRVGDACAALRFDIGLETRRRSRVGEGLPSAPATRLGTRGLGHSANVPMSHALAVCTLQLASRSSAWYTYSALRVRLPTRRTLIVNGVNLHSMRRRVERSRFSPISAYRGREVWISLELLMPSQAMSLLLLAASSSALWRGGHAQVIDVGPGDWSCT